MANKTELKIAEHGSVKLIDVPVFLAKYRDGHDQEAVRLGVVVGGEVRFLEEKMLSKPAQTWLKNDILIALGLKDPAEVKEEKTGGNGLENQV
jgi:hypothetical protein